MRHPLLIIFLSVAFIFSLSCAPAAVYKPQLSPYTPGEAKWVKKAIARMTVKQKVGQMIGCRYNGLFVNQDSDYLRELVDLVTKEEIGSLAIFAGEVYETA